MSRQNSVPRVVRSDEPLRDGVVRNVPGNHFEKHNSNNPLVKLVMDRFHRVLFAELRALAPTSILDVGCGEGYTTELTAQEFDAPIVGLELETAALQQVPENHRALYVSGSAYGLPFEDESFDVVLATEVLEHLSEPEVAIREAMRVARRYCVFTVPHEPFFRAANMSRGAYLSDWGNTPGHVQNWTRSGFRGLLESECSAVRVRNAVIWSVGVCKK